MRKPTTPRRIRYRYFGVLKCNFYLVLCVIVVFGGVFGCSPGRSGFRRRSTQKLSPLVFKQHVPNVPENSLSASGPSDGRIRRGDERFKKLVPNYNADVVWTDRKGTGSDRIMTRHCKERLDMLAISVQNQWPGVRLRVTEGFDEDGFHTKDSLHHSARAVDITTSDRDTSKYGLLARMAVNSGFDFVYYESRSHIHCSVKKEQPTSRIYSGCFHRTANILTRNGSKTMQDLKVGDEIVTGFKDGNSLHFSKVIAFLHRDEHMKSVFIQLETESGQVLLMTKNHLIFRYVSRTTNPGKDNFNIYTFELQNGLYNSEAIHAEFMQVGDFVYTRSMFNGVSVSKVTKVTFVMLTGVYAPLTESGTVLVDDVFVSCYAIVADHNLAHAVFLPVRFLDWIDSLYFQIYSNKLYEYLSSFTNFIETWFLGIDVENVIGGSKPYIHWYARLLCCIMGLFSTICE